MTPLTFYLKEEADTCALGAALAGVLEKGLSIHLKGGLGAGKTTLTRALLRATGYQGKVKSPTYTLVEPYTIMLDGEKTELLHFDLYRMGCAEEFLDAGFRESFSGGLLCTGFSICRMSVQRRPRSLNASSESAFICAVVNSFVIRPSSM